MRLTHFGTATLLIEVGHAVASSSRRLPRSSRRAPPRDGSAVGEVTGFILEWEGQKGCVYITGDTVFYGGITNAASRFDVAVAIVHLGCASWGRFRFTMNAREAKEKRADVDRAFAAANLTSRLTWLELGDARDLQV